MILRSSGSCRRPYLPGASLSLKLANSLPASSQSQTHVPVIPDSHATTLCQYFPCSKSPQGQVQSTGFNPIAQSQQKLFKLAGPNPLTPFCLTFPWQSQSRLMPVLSPHSFFHCGLCAWLPPTCPLGTVSNKHFFQWH